MTINYVSTQSCNGQQGTSTLVNTFTFTSSASSITAGSFLCVFLNGVASNNNSFSWAVSDNVGNTYVGQATNPDDGETGCWAAFVCTSTTGNPTQFTLNPGSGNQIGWAGILVDVFTGVNATGTLAVSAQSQQNPGTGNDAITTPNVTPTAAGVIWGCVSASAGGTVVGTGESAGQTTSTFISMISGYKACSTSPIASTWTNSTNGGAAYFDSIAISLVAAAGAAAPTLDWEPDSQFPRRNKPRMLAWDSKEEETWPFTATGTPQQFGWNVEPQFPDRRKPRPYQPDEPAEQWPFTATGTPQQFGWNIDPQFPMRNKPRTLAVDSKEEEVWPFTATITPQQFGWNVEVAFPVRRRSSLYHADDFVPFQIITATVTPTQFGFDWNPQFPVRRRWQATAIDGQREELLRPVFAPTVVFGIVPELVPFDYSLSRSWLLRTAKSVNALLRGNIGASLQVTLAAQSLTSTIYDARITPATHLTLTPLTASAATAMVNGLYIVPNVGYAVINHAFSMALDQTFSAAILR